MNSMSNRYYDECKKEREDERDHGRERERKEEKCPTIVKCGCPSSTPINKAKEGEKFIVASLTLDTSCICDPSIKLEFASNIVISDNDSGNHDVGINFKVFKQCKHQHNPIPVGPVWSFFTDEKDLSTTFSFFVCDSDSCDNECCTYTVVATVADRLNQGSLFVNNATIGAIATCKKKCHECKKEHRY
ncbi:DUF4489 domain-containing protein [Clostridium nigeriense]|uniref:DUF4489 domain-containing protein n=1 Tax=Clostridium nigeriense TaxID=1805470 RepID=UPI003D32D3C0